MRAQEFIKEAKQATAKQVLSYINKTHHEPFRPGEDMYAAVMAHPRWELQRVPLLNLNIPDQEYDDVDYYDNPPESDPYNRVMTVDPAHAGEISQHLVDRYPIVIDSDRYIIDGNHRAWAAKYLLNRDYIQAWVPVKKQTVKEDMFGGINISLERDDDEIMVRASAAGRQLGSVLFVEYDGVLTPQDLEVDERFRGQGIARTMYDYVKSQGYRIRRSGQQTDAGAGFWGKHRPDSNVWEAHARLPAAIEEFLDSLTPDDCGVEDIGPYRIHFEGFTSDCKSSADYRRNPEAVYQQVYRDFIQREGGRKPLVQDMVGDEDFPILYSIFKIKPIKENFADGKVKGKSRPGRVKRSGASCAGSVTSLRAKAKKYGGERGKMYHWCANMKSGRKKNK